MHYLAFALFSIVFWLTLTASTSRRAAIVAVAGVLVATMVVAPPVVDAQVSLVQAIQAVLSVINGVIQAALNAINTARAAINTLYQTVIWPVQLVNQARSQILQMINQYRGLMAGILNIRLNSASLPTPQSLETLARDHRVNNFSAFTQAFASTYRAIPAPTDASRSDRDMSDLDDALTLDTLKTLKVSDNATDLEIETANTIENSASQAAPGSAPFLTASAVASSIQSQALTQKMLAAELRQEAGYIAHGNGLRKRGAAFAAQLRGVIINLLQHK
jgi:hypothetical protein